MASNTVIVRVLGNTRSLSKSLKKAQVDLGGLDRINQNISTGFRTAAISAAVFSAAAIGAGAAGAAALAAVPLAIAGIGIAFAAQNKQVKNAFSTLKTDVVAQMKGFAEPLVQPLVRTADALGNAFDVIAPAIKQTFAATAPLINQFNQGLIPVAKQIRPLITQSFKAGVPVLQAFGRAVTPITKGFRGFFKALEGGNQSKAFVDFVDQLGQSLKQLLPALGRFLTALAPIGTVMLSVLIPALVSLLDFISGKIGPAFEKLSGTISEHPTLFKNIGIGVLVFVAAIKVATLSVAVWNAAMIGIRAAVLAFHGVMLLVRAATIVWTNAQWALNIAMAANPIGVVVVAIAALVAALVIAYKKSETFRNVVNKAWNGIKTASVAVFNFLKTYIKQIMIGILVAITGPVGLAVLLIVKNWNSIKSATTNAWNAVRNYVRGAIVGAQAAVRGAVSSIKGAVSGAWNSAKTLTTSAWNSIKDAVTRAITSLMTEVNGIKSDVIGALAGIGTWLYSAGQDLIMGMVNGVKSMAGALADAAKGAASGAVNGVKGFLGIKSPSRVFKKIGKQTIQGLIIGFKEGKPGIKKAMDETVKSMTKRMRKAGFSNKRLKKANKELSNLFDKREKRLVKHAQRVKKINNRVARAQEKLADLRKKAAEYAKSVADSARNYGSITSLNSAFNSDAMLKQMRARIEKVRKYNTLLADLIKKGLNKSIVDQLAQAGAEGGMSYALAIQAGGKGAITEFNALQGQLNTASNALGNTAKGSMYNAGIQAAQGLVRGLKARARNITKAANSFARALVKAVKKSLGIKSPSRVFARLGEQTLQGMELGLKDVRGVERAVVKVADAMKNSFDKPQLSATAMSSGGNGGNTNVTVNVNVPATADKAAVGREIANALDAYYKQGGRRANL